MRVRHPCFCLRHGKKREKGSGQREGKEGGDERRREGEEEKVRTPNV